MLSEMSKVREFQGERELREELKKSRKLNDELEEMMSKRVELLEKFSKLNESTPPTTTPVSVPIESATRESQITLAPLEEGVEEVVKPPVVHERDVPFVYIEMPVDMRLILDENPVDPSKFQLGEDSIFYEFMKYHSTNDDIRELFERYDLPRSPCVGHIEYVYANEVFKLCYLDSHRIFWELMNFPRYIIRCPETRFDGRSLGELFFNNQDPLDLFLFAQYVCTSLEYEKTQISLQLFVCFHCDPLVRYFTVDHTIFKNNSSVYRFHGQIIREIYKWFYKTLDDECDFLFPYMDFEFIDYFLTPFRRSKRYKRDMNYLLCWEELINNDSFKSARSYFDPFFDSSDEESVPDLASLSCNKPPAKRIRRFQNS